MAVNKTLATYLNDHLAGSVAGRDLARKLANHHAGTTIGPQLSELAADIETDQITLADLMDRLGVPKDVFKQAGSWTVEKLGRLRFVPQLTGSPALSLFMELEMLSMGVHGKRSLWQALREVATVHPALADVDLDTLVKRAEDQLDRLERLRLLHATPTLTA
ncbi:MAG: hypothetical protein ACRD12_22855 [Acidimicrobiales bacterium]